MSFRYFRHAAFIATLLSVASAQQSSVVPQDLQGGFRASGKDIQVSYSGNAVDGFQDGTSFEKDAVASEPTFALGDSSGISPTTLYTVLMIDTTCPNARKLHYARSNFKNNFNIVSIETDSAALLDYKAPGALGETGDDRQYTFLLYTNPARKQIDQLKLPAEGENFDVKQFQTDNGLPDASAGVGMVVKLGGTADCNDDQPKPAESSAVEVSSTDAGPTSTATSAAEQQSSSVTSATPTEDTNVPENTSSPSSTTDGTDGSSDSGQSTTSSRRTSDRTTTSIIIPTIAPGPSTIVSTVVLSSNPGGADASGTPTASASPALQTTNAAPGVPTAHGLAIAPLLAVAGVLLW